MDMTAARDASLGLGRQVVQGDMADDLVAVPAPGEAGGSCQGKQDQERCSGQLHSHAGHATSAVRETPRWRQGASGEEKRCFRYHPGTRSHVALSRREPALVLPQRPTPSSESPPSPGSFETGDEDVVQVILIQEWVVELRFVDLDARKSGFKTVNESSFGWVSRPQGKNPAGMEAVC